MIRITCPNCASRLNAKDELAGQVRKCPKCGHPVRIVVDAAPEPDESGVPLTNVLPGQHVQPPPPGLKKPNLPKRLNRESHYLICGDRRLIATWAGNGQGWMLKMESGLGLANAKRNRDQLPAFGDFKLVELKFHMTPEGKRLTGLEVYQLAPRWALMALDQDEDQILDKVTGFGALNREQKIVVRQALKDQFMRSVWGEATEVLEYLASTDYHSHSVGQAAT